LLGRSPLARSARRARTASSACAFGAAGWRREHRVPSSRRPQRHVVSAQRRRGLSSTDQPAQRTRVRVATQASRQGPAVPLCGTAVDVRAAGRTPATLHRQPRWPALATHSLRGSPAAHSQRPPPRMLLRRSQQLLRHGGTGHIDAAACRRANSRAPRAITASSSRAPSFLGRLSSAERRDELASASARHSACKGFGPIRQVLACAASCPATRRWRYTSRAGSFHVAVSSLVTGQAQCVCQHAPSMIRHIMP
jgi:hypothetical protein